MASARIIRLDGRESLFDKSDGRPPRPKNHFSPKSHLGLFIAPQPPPHLDLPAVNTIRATLLYWN